MININIGFLGHVDSGKTSIARAISTVQSTAAFDKSPQSQERGITLDLGFSAFTIRPEPPTEGLNDCLFTIVDCPGHASLVRTVIGGAQIIDIMVLVIDVTKGIQTQTAECIVIGGISCKTFLIVLNKIDLLPEEERDKELEKVTTRIKKALSSTPMKDADYLPFCALQDKGHDEISKMSVERLRKRLVSLVTPEFLKNRNQNLQKTDFLMYTDHCFAIKGKGTILTGTVLSGTISVNSTIEIPLMKIQRKVKSIQIFHKPVNQAIQGDRIGLCIPQISDLPERTLICHPNSVSPLFSAIVSVTRIQWYKDAICSKEKYHITIGHTTAMAQVLFFGKKNGKNDEFSFSEDYYSVSELCSLDGETVSSSQPEQTNDEHNTEDECVWALINFEQPILVPNNAIYIASKLDMDVNTKKCRLAFHGRLLAPYTLNQNSNTPKLRVFKNKVREGVIDRIVDKSTVICKSLFKKETLPDLYLSLIVTFPGIPESRGKIESTFGKTGKIKVLLESGEFPRSVKDLVDTRVILFYRVAQKMYGTQKTRGARMLQ